jgi:O-acetyl-ADP-ribose deacetylase (regulator of RNase III)
MVKYVKGDLLDSDCDYICHQVNCQGVMRSGIAKQIRERWPEVYESYKRLYDIDRYDGTYDLLDKIDISHIHNDNRHVINMFAQNLYGYDGGRYTSYDAFDICLRRIKNNVPHGSRIGFPKNIGCGLGGGNWKVISALIEEILGEDFDVYIYEKE